MFKKILKVMCLLSCIFFVIAGIGAFLEKEYGAGVVIFVIAGAFFYGFKKINTKKVEAPKNQENTKEAIKEEAKEIKKIKKETKEPRKKEESKPKEKHGEIEFEVAGTYIAERQKVIKKFVKSEIKGEYIEAYGGLKTKDIKDVLYEDLEVYEVPEDYTWKNEITLEKEPDNEYDKNAIKVILNGYSRIGYVPKKQNVEIGKILEENKNINTEMLITGGKYKLWDGEELETDEEDYEVSIKIIY